jgi:hypothetical protein
MQGSGGATGKDQQGMMCSHDASHAPQKAGSGMSEAMKKMHEKMKKKHTGHGFHK